MTEWRLMSELEQLIAEDMFFNGYDYRDKADVIEYWMERL